MRTLMLAVVAGLLFSMATFSGVTRTMSAELEEYSWFRVEPNLPHAVTGEKLVIKVQADLDLLLQTNLKFHTCKD